MSKWKTYQISGFVILCICLNVFGRGFTTSHSLPLWLDSFGTVLSAFLGGPLVGIMVGITGNLALAYGMKSGASAIYSLVSVGIALIVWYGFKKGWFYSLYETLLAGFLMAVVSMSLSVYLDLTLFEGSTGNLWGDGIVGYLTEQEIPRSLAVLLGSGAIEIPDKCLTVLLLFVPLRLSRFLKRRGEEREAGEERGEEKKRGRLGGGLSVLLLGALLLSGSLSAPARASAVDYNDYVQTIFSNDNGLLCGEANDIAMTHDGILWVGTYNGLYRYNGKEFRWISNYENIRNVNCLYVDEEGRLWIGSNDSGLAIAINEKLVNILDSSSGLPDDSVRTIIQGSDGFYYIGTSKSMEILNLNGGIKKVGTLSEVTSADNLAADERGHVAACTADGRLFLMREGQVLCSLRLLEEEEFNCCEFDREGRLLAGTTQNHIYVYDISGEEFELAGSFACDRLSHLNDMYLFNEGEIFVSADNGVGYLDLRGEFHFVNTNAFNNSIDKMILDYQGNLWFTSSRLGLLRMAPSSFKDVYNTVGMEQRVVNSVTFWNGAYYIGTDAGLDVVDSSCRNQIFSEVTRQFEGNRIRCLYVDREENLWLCTYKSGLVQIRKDGTQTIYSGDGGGFGRKARVVKQLANGEIVAGGDSGVSFIDPQEGTIVKSIGHAQGLVNPTVLTLTELVDGTVLVGTDGSGIAVIKNHELVRVITQKDGLSSEVILRTVRDTKSGGVFIVTSNGLCFMNDVKEIRPLYNFPYFNCYDIWVRDPETLFVMSSAGIYVVKRDDVVRDIQDMNYELLNVSRGLQGSLTANSWNYADEEGNLFLSCDKGVYIIDAFNYKVGSYTYRMKLSKMALDGQMVEIERDMPIRIGREIRRADLYPEIINYTIQDPFAGYYLEGYDSDWTYMAQSDLNVISFRNLPVGEYTLHLAVFDGELKNVLAERRFTILKEKEIYDEPWFLFYMFFISMMVVGLIAALVVLSLVRHQIELQNMRLELQGKELEMANRQVEMGNQTIVAIVNAVDAKDERTRAHSERVAIYSEMIARDLGFDEKECKSIKWAAQMHDIGKIAIPDRILNKPSRLTDEEYEIMKSHVIRGANILKDFSLLDHAVDGAKYHHERYDGRGYPEGLKGEEIPLYGRLIAVADAFDAMTSNRVYRNHMDLDYVVGELKKGRGSQFDPVYVDAMLKIIGEGRIDVERLYTRTEKKEKEEESV